LGFSGAPILRRVLGFGPLTAVGIVSTTHLDESANYATGAGVRAADLRAAVPEVPGLGDAVRRGRSERSRLPRLWALSVVTLVVVFVLVSLAVPTAGPPGPALPDEATDPVVAALPAICDPTSLPAMAEFTPSPLGAQFVYAVSSQHNSRPLVIRPGGWVMQAFVATTPFISGMSTVPSVSAGRSENLAYEIVRPVDNSAVWRSSAVVDDTNKDGPVPGDMPRPVPVQVGPSTSCG
jgi:hypothetical protein